MNEKSELKSLKIRVFLKISCNCPNSLFGINVYKTLESC